MTLIELEGLRRLLRRYVAEHAQVPAVVEAAKKVEQGVKCAAAGQRRQVADVGPFGPARAR